MEAFESVDFITKRSEALEFIDDCESSLLMLLDSKGGSGKGVADRAREYVMQHVMEKITLGDVADHACVSPSYMSKSFKRIMGISLVDYINSTKVEKAKATRPRPTIISVSRVRNLEATVVAPTDVLKNMVTMFIMAF